MSDEMKRALSEIKTELTKVGNRLDSVDSELGKLRLTDHRIAAEVSRLGGKVDDLHSLGVSTRSAVDRLVGAVESFTKDVEAAQRDRITASDAYMKHQGRLDDHEARLSRLESKRE